MTQDYINLFIEIAKSAELLAEQVMDYDHSQNDERGERVAKEMRDDFMLLSNNLQTNGYTLNRRDYAQILVGATAIANNIETKIEIFKKALEGYKIDLIPKLQRILDEVQTEEQLAPLVNELFSEK